MRELEISQMQRSAVHQLQSKEKKCSGEKTKNKDLRKMQAIEGLLV